MSTSENKIVLDTTQQRVFDYMTENGGITSLLAVSKLGETRLSARIYELKAKGVPVNYEWIKVKNRFGEPRRVKIYFIGNER